LLLTIQKSNDENLDEQALKSSLLISSRIKEVSIKPSLGF
jgi:hypothetical protein